MAEPKDMWRCQMVNCGYVYDPDRGDKRHKIPAGTRFEDLPEDWKCPVCGATKKSFRPLSDESSPKKYSRSGGCVLKRPVSPGCKAAQGSGLLYLCDEMFSFGPRPRKDVRTWPSHQQNTHVLPLARNAGE